MSKNTFNASEDYDLVVFCNRVVDKIAGQLAKHDPKPANLDIRSFGNKLVPCWVLPVEFKLLAKRIRLDVVFAKTTTLEVASHSMHATRRDMIVLSILNSVKTFNKAGVLRRLKLDGYLRRSTVHEIVHHIIAKRFPSKAAYMKYSIETDVWSIDNVDERDASYYNEPTEMNTHYFEIVHDTLELDRTSKHLKTFENYLKFARSLHHDSFFDMLTDENMKKVKDRLHNFWHTYMHGTFDKKQTNWKFWMPEGVVN